MQATNSNDGKVAGTEVIVGAWDAVSRTIRVLLDRESLNESKPGHAINTNIPNGFHLERTIRNLMFQNHRSEFTSVLYAPIGDQDRFLTMDIHNVHVWKQMNNPVSYAVSMKRMKIYPTPPNFLSVDKWLYISQLKILVISTSAMELKVWNY
jgi:hypothetical protein